MPSRTDGLTERQRSVLGFIEEFMGQNGYSPSLREICSRFGIRSPKNAAKHLDALEKKGFIKRRGNVSRAITPGRPAAWGVAVSVPIAGRVRAGSPTLAVEDITGYVKLDGLFFKCAGAFLLRVVGESMTGAGIDDGDYVVVSPAPSVENGEIAVAVIDGEATVKRLFKAGSTVTLKPENPAMGPITVAEGEGREIYIAGKVVAVIKLVERRVPGDRKY